MSDHKPTETPPSYNPPTRGLAARYTESQPLAPPAPRRHCNKQHLLIQRQPGRGLSQEGTVTQNPLIPVSRTGKCSQPRPHGYSRLCKSKQGPALKEHSWGRRTAKRKETEVNRMVSECGCARMTLKWGRGGGGRDQRNWARRGLLERHGKSRQSGAPFLALLPSSWVTPGKDSLHLSEPQSQGLRMQLMPSWGWCEA